MTQAPVYKTVQAKVNQATIATKTIQGETRDVWDLRILVDGLSQYDFPCSMPMDAAAVVKKGEVVNGGAEEGPHQEGGIRRHQGLPLVLGDRGVEHQPAR